MEERIQQNYYYNSRLKFVDTHISTKACIEKWLSKLLFKDDISRVIYSAPDIIFRKRIESLDKGKNEEEPLKAESLQLPFASFYMSSDPEGDDRPASVNHFQSVTGEYIEDVDRNIRSLATMAKYKISCFYSRRDDIRFAQQLVLWEQEPKYQIRLLSPVQYKNTTLDLPIFITIDNIVTNPDYKETEWLEKNRIFIMDIELTVRSYQLLINNIEKIIQLPIRFHEIKDTYEEDEENISYITEKVILQWAENKFSNKLDFNKEHVNTEDEELKELSSKLFEKVPLTNSENTMSMSMLPSRFTEAAIKSYWQDEIKCELVRYLYDEKNSTDTEAYINFKVKPGHYKYFSKIIMSIPTKESVEITDCHQMSVVYPGLYPNSEYTLTITVFDTEGDSFNYYLKFKTKNSETNQAPQQEKLNMEPAYIGGSIIGMQI